MGPKKKGKGSKLARMSDEERARYLQHRAAIEEEARRRKEQLISTFMKNKLKKEEAFSRLNVAKINQQWRQTLRKLKCTELKQDLNALHFWFDHTAEKKNQLIDCLLGDLQEAECQYSRIHQCHMETIDKLLGIYNDRITTLRSTYEEERDRLKLKALAEMKDLNDCANAQHDHLQAVIFRQQQTADEITKKVVAAHDITVDELRNQMLTELENLEVSREARMETLWNSFQAVLQDYWARTEDRRREYLNLRDVDGDNCNFIFHYHQQINTHNDLVANLKKQLNMARSEEDDRVVEKKAEKANCMELFHVLRHKLTIETQVDRKKLCRLSDAAQKVTKDLETTLVKAEQIFQLVNLCKKLEAPNEKVCKVGPREDHELELDTGEIEEPLAASAVKKFSKLNGFWKKYNEVLIEKEALALHCKSLAEEQKRLKYVLKQYFAEYSEAPSLPKVPLTVHRPATGPIGLRKAILLRGEKVIPRSGKIEAVCTDRSHGPSFLHTLTIELTKPV